MPGRVSKGCAPSHMRRTGRGWRICMASGFVRDADDVIDDVRQSLAAKEFADITPGFGTHHPKDVVNLGVLDDPSPIERANPGRKPDKSKQDLNISDAEILASIREGRQPRSGF